MEALIIWTLALTSIWKYVGKLELVLQDRDTLPKAYVDISRYSKLTYDGRHGQRSYQRHRSYHVNRAAFKSSSDTIATRSEPS